MLPDLLARVSAAGIILELNATCDGFTASPASAVTPELRSALKANKPAILWRLLCQDWIDGDCSDYVLTRATQIRAFRAVADEAGIAASIPVVARFCDAVEQRSQPLLGDADDLWDAVQQQFLERIWPDVDCSTAAITWALNPAHSNQLEGVPCLL